MTPEEHEGIKEALAGHALHALDEAEAGRAEAMLASHVPSCPECLAALEEYRFVAGELALAVSAKQPPVRLGSRIRRDTRARTVAAWAAPAVGTAAAVAIASVVLWNLTLTGRVSRAEDRSAQTTAVLTAVAHPASRVVPMSIQNPQAGTAQLTAAYVPGRRELFVFGSLPAPTRGSVYQVWLVAHDGVFSNAGTFVPNAGSVLLRIPTDPSTYAGVLITQEPHPGSDVPSSRHMVRASF